MAIQSLGPNRALGPGGSAVGSRVARQNVIIGIVDSTLTIRLSAAQREALKRRAAALKTTESALIREPVEREMADTTFGERIKGWAGSVSSARGRKRRSDPWRDHLCVTKGRHRRGFGARSLDV
jgi:hypothetical protein